MKNKKTEGRIIKDTEVKKEELSSSNLIIVGNTSNNRIMTALSEELPAIADGEKVTIKKGKKDEVIYNGKEYGVTYFYPNLYNTANSMILIFGNSDESLKNYDFGKSDIIVSIGKRISSLYFMEKAFINFEKNWSIERVEEVDSKLLDPGENDKLILGDLKKYPFPEWARGKIIYEIFVRSFYDSDGNGIGDLKGVVSKLDYLESLGVDVIWLMPIFDSPSYHGYDTKDYFRISKDYGTNEDFFNLAKEVHKRGMKIILDVAFNQTSKFEPHFKDAYGNPDSKYDKWFYFHNLKNTLYNNYNFKDLESERGGSDGTMPAWNTNNLEVVDFHTSIAKFWMDPNGDGDYSDGCDGFRLDYAKGPSHEYWKLLYQKIKEKRSDVLLIGEAWLQQNEIALYFDKQFDAVYDFNLQGSATTGLIKDVENALTSEKISMPENAYFSRFLSNHDMDRFPTFKNLDELKLYATLIYTIKGMPTVYYGDEIGMKGDKGDGDEGVRSPMEWYKNNKGEGMTTWKNVYNKNPDGVSVEEQEGKEGTLLEYYKKLSAIRKANLRIIEEGKKESISVYEIKNGKENSSRRVHAYIYIKDGKSFMVILNFGKEGDYILDFTKISELKGEVKDISNGRSVIKLKNEKINFKLEANRAYIFSN